jgi:hypothetical protein
MTDNRIIITPAEAGAMGVGFVQRVHEARDRLLPISLPGEISHYFAPLLPGELVMVVAQTHNGKSLFMRLWAERMMAHLKANGRGDEAIVWVDTEQPAEYVATGQVAARAQLTYSDVMGNGGLDPAKLVVASNAIADTPFYIVATRLGSKGGGGEVHLTNIKSALAILRDGKLDGTPRKIAAVFVDYLQSLPIDPTVRRADIDSQRRLQVARDVDTLRAMGARLDCPVIVGVQAKQTLSASPLEKAFRLPSIYDGQETANIAQRPDRIISLSVASRHFTDGEIIEYKNNRFQVRPGLMFLSILKQRAIVGYLPAGHVFAFEIQDTTDPMAALAHVWSEWMP